MRQIIRTIDNFSETLIECASLEEALFRLKTYRDLAENGELFYISYDDKHLNLEEWEEEWIETCSERDKRLRESLAEERKNGTLPPEEIWEDLDWEDYEPTDKELQSRTDEDFYYEHED